MTITNEEVAQKNTINLNGSMAAFLNIILMKQDLSIQFDKRKLIKHQTEYNGIEKRKIKTLKAKFKRMFILPVY